MRYRWMNSKLVQIKKKKTKKNKLEKKYLAVHVEE